MASRTIKKYHKIDFRSQKVVRKKDNIFTKLLYVTGMTRVGFARLIGINENQITAYCAGSLHPSVRIAKRMQQVAKIYGIELTLDEVFEDKEDNEELEQQQRIKEFLSNHKQRIEDVIRENQQLIEQMKQPKNEVSDE